jgi:hypothetical protein
MAQAIRIDKAGSFLRIKPELNEANKWSHQYLSRMQEIRKGLQATPR